MGGVLIIKSSCSLDSQFVVPPIGVAYLAAGLRNRSSVKIHFLDMNLGLSVNEILRKAREMRPEAVAVSSMTPEYKNAEKLVTALKMDGLAVPYWIGGPHASSCAERIVGSGAFDCAGIGEGEETFPELVETLSGQRKTESVKGIVFREGSSIIRTEDRPSIENLDRVAFPDWNIFELDKYYEMTKLNILMAGKRFMPIFTTRGCPYRCIYCHNIFGKKVRFRSAENVFQEMTLLHEKHQIDEFAVIDDVFNIDPRRAEELCDLIIESGMKIKISFQSGLRADLVNEQLLRKLKRAGTYLICYAIESASPRLQQVIKKKLHLEKTKQVIEQTNKLGILTIGFFLDGLPSETREEIEQSIQYACSSKLNFASFMSAYPFPGTEISKIAEESGFKIDYDSPDVDYFKPAYSLGAVNMKELGKLKKTANARFLMNPLRTFNTMRRLPAKRKILSMLSFYAMRAVRTNKVIQKVDA